MLNFKGPYHNIRMRLGNVLVVRDLYGLPSHSDHFSVLQIQAFVRYFRLKNLLFMFFERDFRVLYNFKTHVMI